MSFQSELQHHYPGNLPLDLYIKKVTHELHSYGFQKQNSLPCICTCRDEITRPLVSGIEKEWGESFNFSSLGGVLRAGKTGFDTAKNNAPTIDGAGRFVFFAMPHISIDKNGIIGRYERHGQEDATDACEALLQFQSEMSSGRLDLELDSDDIEYSLLKQKLIGKVNYSRTAPTLVSITNMVYESVLKDLEQLIDLKIEGSFYEYAIITGIQVHGPNNTNFIWPGKMYVVSSGYKIDLTIPSGPVSANRATPEKLEVIEDFSKKVQFIVQGHQYKHQHYLLESLQSFQTEDLSDESLQGIKKVIAASIIEHEIPRYERNRHRYSHTFFIGGTKNIVYQYLILSDAEITNKSGETLGGFIGFLVCFVDQHPQEDTTKVYYRLIANRDQHKNKIQRRIEETTVIIQRKMSSHLNGTPVFSKPIKTTRALWKKYITN